MKAPPGCPLTKRQYEILIHIGRGRTYKQVAQILGICVSTVRTHLHFAFERLDVVNQSTAIAKMFDQGWMPSADMERAQQALNKALDAVAKQQVDAIEANIDHRQAPLPAFALAYLEELDAWLESGMKDDVRRVGMKIALGGLMHQARGRNGNTNGR